MSKCRQAIFKSGFSFKKIGTVSNTFPFIRFILSGDENCLSAINFSSESTSIGSPEASSKRDIKSLSEPNLISSLGNFSYESNPKNFLSLLLGNISENVTNLRNEAPLNTPNSRNSPSTFSTLLYNS